MNNRVESFLNHPNKRVQDSSNLKHRPGVSFCPNASNRFREIIFSIIVGLVMSSALIFSSGSQLTGLVILAIIAIAVVIVVDNLRKLLLIVLVVDIPLGLDIGIANRLDHNGGPSGFIISLMTLAIVVGVIIWLTDRHINSQLNKPTYKDISVPALIYMFTMLISFFQATNVWFSITQFFLEIQFLIMCFFIISQVKTWGIVRLIFTTLTFCLLLESIVILLQYFTGLNFFYLGIHSGALGRDTANETARLGGTLGHPNVAATYLTASLFITFTGFLANNWLVNRKLAFVAFLVGTLALITTQSRSSWIIFAVLLPIVSVQALKKRIGLKVILIFCIIVVIIGAGFSRQIIDRFTTNDHGSAESRVWQTELALNILGDHMLTGVGLNNLWEVIPKYLPPEMYGNINVIHDKYLTVWVETGILGLISFLWLLLATVIRAVQALKKTRDRYTSLVITGLLAAILVLVFQMSVTTFNERSRLQLLWLIIALIVATSEISKGAYEVEDLTFHSIT